MNDKSLHQCINGLLEKNLINTIQDSLVLCDSCQVAKAKVQIHFNSGNLNFCNHHFRVNLRAVFNQIEKETAITLEHLLPEKDFVSLVIEGGASNAI